MSYGAVIDGVPSEPQETGSPQIIHPFADEGNYDAIQIVREYRIHRDFYTTPNPDEIQRDADFPWAVLCVQRIVGINGGMVTFQRVYANVPETLTTWGNKIFEKPTFGESWRGQRIYTESAEAQIIPESELAITGDTQGAVTGGTFTLTTLGQTTSALAYNASAATIETALNGLSNVAAAGGVTVSQYGASGGIYEVRWRVPNSSRKISIDPSSLTPTASVIYSRRVNRVAGLSVTLVDSGGTNTASGGFSADMRRRFSIQAVALRPVYRIVNERIVNGVLQSRQTDEIASYRVEPLFSICLVQLPLSSVVTKAQLEDAITSGMSADGSFGRGVSFGVIENSSGNFTISFSFPPPSIGSTSWTSPGEPGVAVGTFGNVSPDNFTATAASDGDSVIEQLRFTTASRSLTITGHGRTATAPGWIVDGTGTLRYVPALTVVDANTLSTPGDIDLAGASSLLVNPRRYRPGNVVSRVRRTREFFLPGVTPGITGPQDIPTYLPSTPNQYLDAVMDGTSGVELTVETDEVVRYLGPIFMQAKTVMLVENATEDV